MLKICADGRSVSGQPSRCSLQYDIIFPQTRKPGAQKLQYDADGRKCYTVKLYSQLTANLNKNRGHRNKPGASVTWGHLGYGETPGTVNENRVIK